MSGEDGRRASDGATTPKAGAAAFTTLPPSIGAVVARQWRLIALTAACGLAGSAADVGVTFSIRRLFDDTLRMRSALGASLLAVLSILGALEAAKAAVVFVRRRSAEIAGQGVVRDLRVDLFAHLVRLPVAFFRRREVGRILLRFVNDLTAIRRFVANGIAEFLADSIAVVCLLAAAVVMQWQLGVGLLVLAPLQFFLVRRFNPRIRQLNARVRGQRARLSGILQDSLSGIEALKVYRRESRETKRVRVRSERMFANSVAQVTVAARGEAAANVVNGIAALFVLGYGGWLVVTGVSTRGTLLGFYALFHHVFPSIRRIVHANQTAQTARVQVERVASFLERVAEPRHAADAARAGAAAGDVVFEGVEGQSDFTVRRGEIVAILGPSGVGKSRLAAILLGLRRPSAGRVLVGGRDVTELAPSELRRLVAWAAADAPLFQGSFSRNVRYGRRHAPRLALEQALRDASLEEAVARRRQGLSFRVGPGGRKLSSGERALVSLARALLVERPLLVLDEPFAALDPTTLERVWTGLQARRAVTTTILFTTDAGLAARCDRVVRFDAAPQADLAEAPFAAIAAEGTGELQGDAR
jgi:ABC-type multidrug transport system fused ATPase/permease subunit